MSIARMEKIQIFGLLRQRHQVLDLLQELGVMQVTESSEEAFKIERALSYDQILSEYEFAISFLEEFEKKEGSFLEGLASGKRPVTYRKVKEVVSRTVGSKTVKRCFELERELFNLNELEKNLVRERELLVPWTGLDQPIKELSESKYVTYFTGSISKKGTDGLKEFLKVFSAAVEVVNSLNDLDYILVAVSKGSQEEVHKRILETELNIIKLPISDRTPSQEIDVIDVAMSENRKRRVGIVEDARKLALKRFDLMLTHDYFLQRKIARTTEGKIGGTAYTFSVEGWIRKRDLEPLKRRVSSLFPGSLIATIEPSDGEEPPVAIDNGVTMRPFETVTGIYGLPAYREVDPTPLLAVFFIVFFGVCLGDAGYGITLSLVAYLFYKKVGKGTGAAKLLKLLIYGGVLTFIAGVLTGGWFGVEPADFPGFLKPIGDFFVSIRIISPVQDTLGMLVVALAFGVVQVIFGIFIDFYIKLRNREYLDALLDDLLWIFYLSSLLALAVQKFVYPDHSSRIFVYLALSGAVILVLTQGRKQKSLILKFGSGILSLYKTVGYLSDVLSYSRILALGLATSIIAMVVNMISAMTKDSVPVLGYIIMLLILVFGHIFNIAVNVLGAFIHSSRLQFVEFFSKFMQGSGDEFEPFARSGKYVEIK